MRACVRECVCVYVCMCLGISAVYSCVLRVCMYPLFFGHSNDIPNIIDSAGSANVYM